MVTGIYYFTKVQSFKINLKVNTVESRRRWIFHDSQFWKYELEKHVLVQIMQHNRWVLIRVFKKNVDHETNVGVIQKFKNILNLQP